MNKPLPRSSPADTAAAAETRALRWLLGVGALLAGLVCVVEWTSGVISPWDRFLQPLLVLLLASYAVALGHWPRHTALLKLAAVTTFNSYLVGTVLVLLFVLPPPLDQYQFLSTVYWLPLGYGAAYVFLAPRIALRVSTVISALLIVPVGVALLRHGPGHWGPGFESLAMVLAIAQMAYIGLMRAIVTMRSGYHRAEQRVQQMHSLATTDALTGLPNRRAMDEHLLAVFAAAQARGRPLSLALIDVDHFKSINDRFGHAGGDQVLVQMGRRLTTGLRADDRLGRWGGEEFVLVLDGVPRSEGLGLAERLRVAVAGHPFEPGLVVTVSIGLAECRADDTPDRLLERADVALYRAKAAGRNRVEEGEGLAVDRLAAAPSPSAASGASAASTASSTSTASAGPASAGAAAPGASAPSPTTPAPL